MIDHLPNFSPELIVEATSVCDRSCFGCYAPNVVSKESAEKLFIDRPELFLESVKLGKILSEILHAKNSKISIVSIRGGEPTRHPRLDSLVQLISQSADQVFLETHGRWITEPTPTQNLLLLSLAQNYVTVKLSFDSMHGGINLPLGQTIKVLEEKRIDFVIAITESTQQEFLKTRSQCSFVPDSKIIFQQKTTNIKELIKPEIGVVRVNGTLTRTLTAKSTFQILPITKNKDSEGVA